MSDATSKESVQYNIPYVVISGVLLSIFFIMIGYKISDYFQRTSLPSFNTYVGQLLTLLFIGLTLGYELAMGIDSEKKSYYFFASFMAPIFFIGIYYNLITHFDIIPIFLLVGGVAFPYVFINSGLLEEHEKFYDFLLLFTNYVPKFIIYAIGLNDFIFSNILHVASNDTTMTVVSYFLSAVGSLILVSVTESVTK